MKRHEIIYALAAYAHPSWYHALIQWDTGNLYKLLKYYQGDLDRFPIFMGVDLAVGPPERSVTVAIVL